MENYAYWFLLALVLLALEMATGTFYMLVIGVALAIGGLAALAGLSLTLQLTFSAVAGIIGTVILHRRKSVSPDAAQSQNPNIGEQVKVLTWHEGGKIRVHYRGTEWDAELASSDVPHDQNLYIKAMRGSTLMLSHQKP
jgi:membrane protein implicated in regulation of membrane protease activity